MYFRGSKFQKEFGHLGEVRGLFPPDVNIMALTATAAPSSCKLICKIKPTYIVLPPDKANIVYSVCKKPDTVEEFSSLVTELQTK